MPLTQHLSVYQGPNCISCHCQLVPLANMGSHSLLNAEQNKASACVFYVTYCTADRPEAVCSVLGMLRCSDAPLTNGRAISSCCPACGGHRSFLRICVLCDHTLPPPPTDSRALLSRHTHRGGKLDGKWHKLACWVPPPQCELSPAGSSCCGNCCWCPCQAISSH